MYHTLLKPLALGLGLVTLALLALAWSSTPPPARAAGPTCTVCLDGSCDYANIQAAVDDEGCRKIKVAQGVYTGVQARPVPAGYLNPPASGLITQVVYISRTVTMRGGYTTTNWTVPDPQAQPTTLDAGRRGRVMVIAGDISPTIEGLGLTNGRSTGLGGAQEDCAGGGYVISATATISGCRVFGNMADVGGGLYLYYSPATLSANSITSNTVTWGGGGLGLWYSPASLISNSVTANTAEWYGGGLHLRDSPATLSANSITSNTTGVRGGGLELWSSNATFNANSIAANTANWGGGLYVVGSSTTFSANSVISNTANRYGGGLLLGDSPTAVTNTVVAGNRAGTNGSGLYVDESELRLLHTTIARNSGGDGSGLYVEASIWPSTMWMTNTILVSQMVGITVAEGCTATMNGTLWYGNGADWDGEGAISHSGDTTGNPAFVDPDSNNYHISPASAAIDRGVDAGVATDKDGRPRDAHPDLGAYEFQGPAIDTYLPAIRKGTR